MEYYLNRFKSTVSSVANQVSQALPGNLIFREYEAHDHIANAGPGLTWKIYSGTKNSTKQPVSIWLFEKKHIERWPKHEREAFPELLKRGVNQLTRLRHPRLLVIERVLEESRDTFAFCTEPVFASLANIFQKKERPFPHLKDFSLLDVEIRHGLFQLSESLVFLHNDAKILHGNICPSSILINEKGAWKLAGFEFCIVGNLADMNKPVFEIQEWNHRQMSIMNPELDYAAPEFVHGVKCDTFADIFSLGVLTYAIFNENRSIIESSDLLDSYKKSIEKLKHLSKTSLKNVPDVLKEDIKVCLNFTPELRPDAIQLTKIAYFEDPLLKTFNYLDSLMQMDNSQKMQFFKNLPSILDKFPKRPLLQKILPYLAAELSSVDLIPFILPNIFLIAEIASPNEFASVILPSLIPIFSIQRPYQTVLLFLQKIPLLLEKTPEAEIKKHVLPLVYTALSNENAKIQELCLTTIPTIGKLVDREAMKSQLLPQLLRMIMDGTILSIRVQTLICLSKLLPNLEPWMITQQIVPSLARVNSKEPAVLMAILGIFKLVQETPKFEISIESTAKLLLPFLMSSCVENSLNLPQFDQYVAFINLVYEKLIKDQRKRLQHLSATQEEQRNVGSFILNSDSLNVDSITNSPKNIRPDLANVFGDTENQNSLNSLDQLKTSKNLSKGDSLSLEQKKRLAAEQEESFKNRKNNLDSNGKHSTQPAKTSPPKIDLDWAFATSSNTSTTNTLQNPIPKASHYPDPFSPPSILPNNSNASSQSNAFFNWPNSTSQQKHPIGNETDLFVELGLTSIASSKSAFPIANSFPAFPQPPSAPQNLIQRNQNRQTLAMSANQSSANLDGLLLGGGAPKSNLKSSADLSSLDGLINFNKTTQQQQQTNSNNISLNDLLAKNPKNFGDPLADIFK